MPISFQEFLNKNPDLQNPLMLPNSEFIKKLSNEDYIDLLNLIYDIIRKDRTDIKETLITMLQKSYVESDKNDFSKVDMCNIRDSFKNII